MINGNKYPITAQLKNPIEFETTLDGMNFPRGLAILLSHAGCKTDYISVMGDLGQAFIMQGTKYSDKITGGYADLGWWPWDRWHIVSRLQFLSWVNGVGINHHDVDFAGIEPDQEKSYTNLFQSTVCEEITHDRALLALWDFCHLVTGYDTEKPPLLGWDLTFYEAQNTRMSHYPCAITSYGSKFEPLDRKIADRMALQHAVQLGRGVARREGLWITGPFAWKGWEDHLVKRTTENFWHGNIKENLRLQRDAAVKYLESMANRNSAQAALSLRKAAGIYHQQLEVINQIPTVSEITKPGKEQTELVALIRQAAVLDLEAIGCIETTIPLLV